VYQGQYLRAEEQTVLLPDGKEARREIVIPPDAVGILALDQSGKVYLVRQYRSAIQRVTLEIPAGILEPGESALETAKRECEEEIGMTPRQLKSLFSFYHSVGFSTGKIEVFLALDLIPSPATHPDSSEFLEVVVLPFEELYQRALRGEIVDSKSIIAILWYRQRVEKS
jgi:ADP-ribose pyrophosphatase